MTKQDVLQIIRDALMSPASDDPRIDDVSKIEEDADGPSVIVTVLDESNEPSTWSIDVTNID